MNIHFILSFKISIFMQIEASALPAPCSDILSIVRVLADAGYLTFPEGFVGNQFLFQLVSFNNSAP